MAALHKECFTMWSATVVSSFDYLYSVRSLCVAGEEGGSTYLCLVSSSLGCCGGEQTNCEPYSRLAGCRADSTWLVSLDT